MFVTCMVYVSELPEVTKSAATSSDFVIDSVVIRIDVESPGDIVICSPSTVAITSLVLLGSAIIDPDTGSNVIVLTALRVVVIIVPSSTSNVISIGPVIT